MIRPEDYENVSISNFRQVPAGGYICKVMQVEEKKSSTDKDMIVISLDIAEGDLKDEFATRYKNDTKADKRWGCVSYVLVLDYENKTNRDFKRFCTSVEESNKLKIDWDAKDWGKQFKGKLVGCLFREEEYDYNGETKVSVKPYQYRSVETIRNGEFQVPKRKELSKPASTSFVPNSGNDDLPF